VLESFYQVARAEVAHLVRAVVAFPSIETERPAELVRALQLYEVERLDFAERLLAQGRDPVQLPVPRERM
jgi:hypothetical protein